MAIPSSLPFTETGDFVVDAITNGYYWIPDRSTIKWSISKGKNGEYWSDPAEAQKEFAAVFSIFSYYANINFQYAGYYSDPAAAGRFSDINISLDAENYIFTNNNQWAAGFFPSAEYSDFYASAPGDVYINLRSQANHLPSYAPGSAGFFLFLHEFGHALGLKHTHDDGGTGRPTLTSLGISAFDKDWFSIMSYKDDQNFNLVSWDPATPMLLDVIGLQYLYGPNMHTNAGNNAHILTLNNYYQTLWDAGGNDFIDISNSSSGWTISLPDQKISSRVPISSGSAIPVGGDIGGQNTFYWLTGDIEGAKGSPYADSLYGSALDNPLFGNGGNDIIDGGAGIDSAVYSSNRSNYLIQRINDQTDDQANDGYRITSKSTANMAEGIDSLSAIEFLTFKDASLQITYNDAVQALYVAYFGRAADYEGWKNFQSALSLTDAPTTVEGLSSAYSTSSDIRALIDAFGVSDESKALYSGDTRSFVTSIYKNILSRAPDTEGLNFWVNAIDFAGLSQGNAALSIMAGALANTKTKAGLLDADLVENKLIAASNFTFAMDTAAEVTAYSGAAAAAASRGMLSLVTANTDLDSFQSTIDATLVQMVGMVGIADDPSLFIV